MIEVVRTLPTQSKLVLYSIVLLGERDVHKIITGDVYNVYRALCRQSSLDILTQRRVSDLISELDMMGIINARIISKGRYGRTKEIVLSIPPMQVRAAIQEDYSIGNLEVLTLPRQLTFA
jgi:cell division control protein 6